MIEREKGNIISIASLAGIRTARMRGAYGISKAGVVMLTKMLAVELGQYNIQVNAIAPGMVKTERSRPSWGNPEALKRIEASAPLRRIGEPRDIASVALFLASEASSYITGHTIVVDGGMLA
jgi:NAD(P)-dependent dehydrogenase (short-subunit alcohol dehydrogenase family)